MYYVMEQFACTAGWDTIGLVYNVRYDQVSLPCLIIQVLNNALLYYLSFAQLGAARHFVTPRQASVTVYLFK